METRPFAFSISLNYYTSYIKISVIDLVANMVYDVYKELIQMEISIGKTIKKLRTEKGITQDELAKYLNITYQSVSKWETEAATPDTMLLPKIAVFFGVAIDNLFTVADDNHFERIDEMLYDGNELTESNFLYIKRYLIGLLDENAGNTEALKRLVELYEKRIDNFNLTAARYAEQAINVDPNDKYFHTKLAGLRGIRPDYELVSWRMFRFYDEFIGKHPNNQQAVINLHLAYAQTNKYAEAEEMLDKITDETVRVKLKADMYIRLGKADEAFALLDKLADDYANDPIVLQDIAERHDKADHFDRALELYEKSFEIMPEPKYLPSLFHRAFMYDRYGLYAKALEMWEEIAVRLKRDWNSESIAWAYESIEILKGKIMGDAKDARFLKKAVQKLLY